MSVEFRAVGTSVPDGLRSFARDRVSYALGRFNSRIRHVTVRFVAADGRLVCRVVADTRHAGRLVVTDRDRDPYTAASRAIGRMGRAVARSVDRARMMG